MTVPHIVWADSCDSTNSVLAADATAVHGTVLAARRQTAGRGQRGNKWESEPGMNLTFSMNLALQWPARRQFELSMLVSLAIAGTIDAVLAHCGRPGLKATVKWPNDIYVGDGKICGILIEHRLGGAEIERSIVGAGINVNQRKFVSDAPNPVSVATFADSDTNLDAMLRYTAQRILEAVDSYDLSEGYISLHERYMSRLWRGDGAPYPFALPDGTRFDAAIADVLDDGTLVLSGGRRFAFKEVVFVL